MSDDIRERLNEYADRMGALMDVYLGGDQWGFVRAECAVENSEFVGGQFLECSMFVLVVVVRDLQYSDDLDVDQAAFLAHTRIADEDDVIAVGFEIAK